MGHFTASLQLEVSTSSLNDADLDAGGGAGVDAGVVTCE